jgi:hypothetical protein
MLHNTTFHRNRSTFTEVKHADGQSDERIRHVRFMHLYKHTINLLHDIYFTPYTLNLMPLKTRYSFYLIYDEE